MGPLLVDAGAGEAISDRDERTTQIKVGRDELTLSWFRYEPGETGPKAHVHRRHSDAFYVIEGEVTFELGPEREVLSGGPGTVVIAPPNVVHTFRNESSGGARFLNIHAPSCGFDEHMRAMRDGREEPEPFDQHDPPPDGGRPLTDARIETGRASDEHLRINEATVEHERRAADAATTSYWVLDGELAVTAGGETVSAGPGAYVLVEPGQEHSLDGPARVVCVRA